MCDTFVALPPVTADGCVIFGKNSDRPRGEAQTVVRYPGRRHDAGARVRCTYIEIAEAPVTFAVLLSRPDWMWGAEMGANEHGVVVGNEAVWTREDLGPPALLGMDLVRLGLERADSAYRAIEIVTGLLEEYGQGGACAENDPGFAYHNSFLIADRREAWVLETAAGFWAAERITTGVRNISNALSIRARFDLASENLAQRAAEKGLYGGTGAFDFAAAFGGAGGEPAPGSREAWGRRLLKNPPGRFTPEIMMDILRHHESGICMHGEVQTTASMVSRLTGGGADAHWMTGAPHPCRSPFKPVPLAG